MNDRAFKRIMVAAAIIAAATWVPVIANAWFMFAEGYHSSQAFKFAVDGDCKSALYHAARGKPHRLNLIERLCPVRP